jgi:hypothetical protein
MACLTSSVFRAGPPGRRYCCRPNTDAPSTMRGWTATAATPIGWSATPTPFPFVAEASENIGPGIRFPPDHAAPIKPNMVQVGTFADLGYELVAIFFRSGVVCRVLDAGWSRRFRPNRVISERGYQNQWHRTRGLGLLLLRCRCRFSHPPCTGGVPASPGQSCRQGCPRWSGC